MWRTLRCAAMHCAASAPPPAWLFAGLRGGCCSATPELRAALAQAASRTSSTAALLCASAALVALLPHSGAELDEAAADAAARLRATALARLRDQLAAADSPSAALRAACACAEALSLSPPHGGSGGNGFWRLASINAAAVARRSSFAAGGGDAPSLVATHVEVSGPTPAARSSLRASLPPPGSPLCRCAPSSPPRGAPPLCTAMGCCRRGSGGGGGGAEAPAAWDHRAASGDKQRAVLGGGCDDVPAPGQCVALPLTAGAARVGFLVLRFAPLGSGGGNTVHRSASASDVESHPLPPLPHGALREAASAVGAWLSVHALVDGGGTGWAAASPRSSRGPGRSRAASESWEHPSARRVFGQQQSPPSERRLRRRSAGSLYDAPRAGDGSPRHQPPSPWSGGASETGGRFAPTFFAPPPPALFQHTPPAGASPPRAAAEARFAAACAAAGEVAAAAALARAHASGALVLASWSTDFTDMCRPEAERLCVAMAYSANLLAPNRVTCRSFVAYVRSASRGYPLTEGFHTYAHAASVAHTAWRFASCAEIAVGAGGGGGGGSGGGSGGGGGSWRAGGGPLAPLDAFVLIAAAVAHDVGHQGLTNAFLVATSSPLAHFYNDASVMESHHAAVGWNLLVASVRDNRSC